MAEPPWACMGRPVSALMTVPVVPGIEVLVSGRVRRPAYWESRALAALRRSSVVAASSATSVSAAARASFSSGSVSATPDLLPVYCQLSSLSVAYAMPLSASVCRAARISAIFASSSSRATVEGFLAPRRAAVSLAALRALTAVGLTTMLSYWPVSR